MERINERIRELRIKADLSQQEVAAALGLTRSGYQMIENGHNGKKFSYLPVMAKLFGCSIDDLFPQMDLQGKTARADGFEDDSLDDFEM